MTSFQVKVLQKKFTLLHAHFSKIVLKYSNEVHLLRYLTPLVGNARNEAWIGTLKYKHFLGEVPRPPLFLPQL
jgi:hypothetical protein